MNAIINYYEPPAGMPSSHLLVLVRARTGMRAGPKKARPCPALTWPAAVPRACGPGAAVLYNYNCIHNYYTNVTSNVNNTCFKHFYVLGHLKPRPPRRRRLRGARPRARAGLRQRRGGRAQYLLS